VEKLQISVIKKKFLEEKLQEKCGKSSLGDKM
jgi:hypothetical protein